LFRSNRRFYAPKSRWMLLPERRLYGRYRLSKKRKMKGSYSALLVRKSNNTVQPVHQADKQLTSALALANRSGQPIALVRLTAEHTNQKEANMRQLILIIVVTFALTSFGCGGGGGGGSSQPQHAPGISNLQYSPNTAVQNQGGGSIIVSGTIDFIDIDGNISTLTITSYDSLGNQKAANTSPITGASGITAGIVGVAAIVDTTVKGNYTFKIYITDSTGLQSNMLTGTFSVT